MRFYWIFAISGAVFALDQFTKWLVRESLDLHESIAVLGQDFFRLTYVENEGIVFGMAFGSRTFLIVFTTVAVIFLIFYIFRMKYNSPVPKIALSVVLGGALGNLYDRIFIGEVVDFLDFDFPDFIMTRWPVFNIADSSISVGMAILIFYLIFFDEK
jgi:signal peptidase II